jgi:hypothetical protein
MSTWNFLVAAGLLFSPPGLMDPVEIAPWQAELTTGLHWVAIQWEVLDPRETKTLLAQHADFADQLKVLQTRVRDMEPLPFLEECRRFPRRQQIEDFLKFNCSYRNELAARLALDVIRADELKAALQESEQLHRTWNTLKDAQCHYLYVLARRQALKELRDRIGLEAFYSGCLPPPVPVWRFVEGN